MPSLVHHLKTLKSIMELEDVTIVQGVDTHIEDCSGLVFYADAGSLEKRLFRNLLHDKVKDLWLI